MQSISWKAFMLRSCLAFSSSAETSAVGQILHMLHGIPTSLILRRSALSSSRPSTSSLQLSRSQVRLTQRFTGKHGTKGCRSGRTLPPRLKASAARLSSRLRNMPATNAVKALSYAAPPQKQADRQGTSNVTNKQFCLGVACMT